MEQEERVGGGGGLGTSPSLAVPHSELLKAERANKPIKRDKFTVSRRGFAIKYANFMTDYGKAVYSSVSGLV